MSISELLARIPIVSSDSHIIEPPDLWSRRGGAFREGMPQVVSDRRWVSFMYSYPNIIPLPAREVRRVADTVARYQFDRLYGSWVDRVVASDAKAAVARSAERYIRQIAG